MRESSVDTIPHLRSIQIQSAKRTHIDLDKSDKARSDLIHLTWSRKTWSGVKGAPAAERAQEQDGYGIWRFGGKRVSGRMETKKDTTDEGVKDGQCSLLRSFF